MDSTRLPIRTEVGHRRRRPHRPGARLRRHRVRHRRPAGPREEHPRVAVVHARTLEALDEPGAAQELDSPRDAHHPVRGQDGSRRLLTVSCDGLPTAYPFALMVPQYETEDVLLGRLRELGGDVHRPYEVAAVTQVDDGDDLTMSTGEKGYAKYVVGADGMEQRRSSGRSDRILRQRLCRVLRARRCRHGVGSGVWTRCHSRSPQRDSPWSHRFPAATTGWWPLLRTPHQARPRVRPAAPGRARPAAPGKVTLAWSSRFRVHHRIADHYRAGRVFLAGDAAHVLEPSRRAGDEHRHPGWLCARPLSPTIGWMPTRHSVARLPSGSSRSPDRMTPDRHGPKWSRSPGAQHRLAGARPRSFVPQEARDRAGGANYR